MSAPRSIAGSVVLVTASGDADEHSLTEITFAAMTRRDNSRIRE